MAFLRLCAAIFAGVVLTGCGGVSVPECADDWVKEAALAMFKAEESDSWIGRLEEAGRRRISADGILTTETVDCSADLAVVEDYLDQEFRLVAARTLRLNREARTRQCIVEVHGRLLMVGIRNSSPLCGRKPATLTNEVRVVDGAFRYHIFLDDEGDAHVRRY